VRREAFAAAPRDVDVSALYHTDVGVKARNQLVSSDLLVYPFFRDQETTELDPARLVLGVDGLKDEFTLLGTSVSESPHYALMAALDGGCELDHNPYVVRVQRGALDLRPPRQPNKAFIGRLRERFAENVRALESGLTPVVKVVRLPETTYIADGKHRAALALLRNLPVVCEDATPILYDSFFAWMGRVMGKRPAEYSKHLALFEIIERTRVLEEAMQV
jgi:hypothetical protein